MCMIFGYKDEKFDFDRYEIFYFFDFCCVWFCNIGMY